MFEYRRTPYLGLFFGAIIGFIVVWALDNPERPLTLAQASLFYALSSLPGLGLAMLGDPAPERAKATYLEVDFYAPKEPAEPAG